MEVEKKSSEEELSIFPHTDSLFPHLLWLYLELLILPGDIPDNTAVNSASLRHFPPGMCVRVYVFVCV